MISQKWFPKICIAIITMGLVCQLHHVFPGTFRKVQVLLGLIPTKFDGHMARYDLNIHGEYDPEMILWHQYTNCLRGQSDYIGIQYRSADPSLKQNNPSETESHRAFQNLLSRTRYWKFRSIVCKQCMVRDCQFLSWRLRVDKPLARKKLVQLPMQWKNRVK